MVIRSREEVAFTAYFLQAAGFVCSVEALCEVLDAGARHGLWDGCIPLGDVAVLWIDYDGGYYHTEERVRNDVAKTRRKLAEDPRYRVLRIRAKAPSLKDQGIVPNDAWTAPFTAQTSPWRQLKDVRGAIVGLLPPSNAAKLASATLTRRHLVDGVVHDTMVALDERYDKEIRALAAEVGDHNARQLHRVKNVKTLLRAGLFVAALQKVRTELGLDPAQLVTFMSDGVAARLTDAEFVAALQKVRTELGLNPAQLVTFMSDGVAARLTDAEFVAALQKVRTELGLDPAQLVTFMSGSVAARLTDAGFVAALQKVRTELGLDPAQLVTFMSNGVAARLTDAEFVAALQKVRTELGLDPAQLVTFMSGSVAARLTDAEFVNKLVETFDGGKTMSRKRVREICKEHPLKR